MLLLYPREILILDLELSQTVGVVAIERSGVPFIQVRHAAKIRSKIPLIWISVKLEEMKVNLKTALNFQALSSHQSLTLDVMCRTFFKLLCADTVVGLGERMAVLCGFNKPHISTSYLKSFTEICLFLWMIPPGRQFLLPRMIKFLTLCTCLCSCFSSLGVTTAHQDCVVISNKGGKSPPFLYTASPQQQT